MDNTFNSIILPYRARSDDANTPNFYFRQLSDLETPVLNYYRTIDPTKILFYLFREKVYPIENKNLKRIILGVKACDLKALHLLDKALLQSGFIDPAYKQ